MRYMIEICELTEDVLQDPRYANQSKIFVKFVNGDIKYETVEQKNVDNIEGDTQMEMSIKKSR